MGFYDCRLCDHSMCMKCYKAAEAALAEAGPEPDENEMQAIFDSICEANIEPVRVGRKLCFRCGFCQATCETREEAVQHIGEEHDSIVQEMSSGMPMGMGMPFGGDMADFFCDGPGPAPKGRRVRKRR